MKQSVHWMERRFERASNVDRQVVKILVVKILVVTLNCGNISCEKNISCKILVVKIVGDELMNKLHLLVKENVQTST